MSDYDLIVLGCGPGGERAAILAARAGKRVVVVEREHVVGGTAINWGAIPSKTLRESAMFVLNLTTRNQEGIRCALTSEITMSDFLYRERIVVQQELELVNRSLSHYKIEVARGHGRFTGPNEVEVTRKGAEPRRYSAGRVVVATGTSAARPESVPFDLECIFDADTILKMPRMVRSMTVVGAGVIGVEYASIFAALGIAVTLVDTRDELLPYLDREIAGILERELVRLGVEVIHGGEASSVERIEGEPPRTRCRLADGRILESEVLLWCVGRQGNTADIGLDAVGLKADARGLLSVNEVFQTAVPHIYAVGDVIGYPALASTSMEQGRQAMRHAFAIPGPMGSTETLPFAIYAIPEVSYIGETEESLRTRRTPYVAGRGLYAMNPRGQICGDTGGMLKLLFDGATMQLLGIHIVGRNASELVHIGQAFMKSNATARQIAETLYNYPTLSDLYRHAALEALQRATS